ncbi:hypothetical protein JCM33374_g1986 [Metschnikowia sp. JCM 33374]|nr:hypothetical protein JCM33374_g1986 [Metschnikowia sp. JCM 33374]
MVASKNDQRVVDHVSMPTDGAVIFPEHHNLNYSTGMADTPEINSLDQFHSNLFQQSSEEHSRVQLEMMENDLFAHTEDVILAYSACNGNASPPFTFWDSADDHSKTSTMLPPHSQETITQPSTITSDLLQADALQDLPVCPTANQSMTSSHPPLQRSMTDGSISVAQNKTPEQLTSVQKPDRETYSPQTDSSNAKSAPVQPSAEPLPPLSPSMPKPWQTHKPLSPDSSLFFKSPIPGTFSAFYWR